MAAWKKNIFDIHCDGQSIVHVSEKQSFPSVKDRLKAASLKAFSLKNFSLPEGHYVRCRRFRVRGENHSAEQNGLSSW